MIIGLLPPIKKWSKLNSSTVIKLSQGWKLYAMPYVYRAALFIAVVALVFAALLGLERVLG
jgi:hypothetical protein